MSMHETPLVDIGLYLSPELTAYLALHYDTKNGGVPADIQKLVDEGTFLDEVKKGEDSKTLAAYGYFDSDSVTDDLWSDGIETVFSSEFTGEITHVDEAFESDDETIDAEYIAYLPASKGKTWQNSGYANVDEIVDEFKNLLGDKLPDDFNYRAHICEFNGTDFS